MIDYSKETRSVEKQVTVLAADTSNTSNHISDQNVHKLGTNRRSEIIAKIGDTGQTYQKIYNDYLDSL